MLDLTLANQTAAVTMSSINFLNEIINPARISAGEKEVENRHFIARIEDELDDLGGAETFYVTTTQGATRKVKGYTLTMEQMTLVGMRESKAVRRSVLEKLRRLQEGKILPSNYIEALESLLKSEKEKVVIAAERDRAIETKAWIGHRREATAMATASVAVRERNKLAERLGESKSRATVLAVERATERKFRWQPLKKWCKENKIEPHTAPDERYGTVRSWPATAWLAVYDIDLSKLL
ncbi:hypothetical protein AB204_18195 [Xenorhabdus khoisanae]|uniref:Uncharacterized protein n=1 Tax=Xenorhabdus khoisanae TaxID=880157 RepID=A0A0J5IKK2_9GAMM|nr:hypothetical protein [Xenorhabdus khoisanae]KMJ43695.1 hypothetical protein AB204_18195 [Xenorhabdus khoisanae]